MKEGMKGMKRARRAMHLLKTALRVSAFFNKCAENQCISQ